MNGFAYLYGRNGQQATGDPQVAELLDRTVENQHRATELLHTLSSLPDHQAINRWTLPEADMIVWRRHWVAEMLWQMATAYLDGVVDQHQAMATLPSSVYTECDGLCDIASDATLEAIQTKSRAEHGASLGADKLMTLPQLNYNGAGYGGVWRAYEAVYMQVALDLESFMQGQVPRSMTEVAKTISSVARPQIETFEFLVASWNTARSDSNRQQIVHKASGAAALLFNVGQQLHNLGLLGSVYAKALAYKPSLQELSLDFDPWLLTDPLVAAVKRSDSQSQQQLADFWSAVVDVPATLEVSAALQTAERTRRIRRRFGKGYPMVPWPSQYLVRFPVTFGTRSFEPGQLIAVYVHQDESGSNTVEVRRTGRVTTTLELLGH